MRSESVLKRKQKRNRIRRTKQIIERVLLTICLIALLAIGSSAILTKATTNEEAKNVYYKYYTHRTNVCQCVFEYSFGKYVRFLFFDMYFLRFKFK